MSGPAWCTHGVNPNTKKALFAALAVICGALATYFSTGCSGALPPKAVSAIEQALCAQALAERVRPDTTLGEALAIAKALPECFAPPAPVGDAGVR